MTVTDGQAALSTLTFVGMLLLAGDRLVHRIIGVAPLEARIGELEKTIVKANQHFSEKMSELTTYLSERRDYEEQTRQFVASMQGELRVMQGYRLDTPNPDDRRRK